MDSLEQRIKEARQHAQLTQPQLAELIGVSRRTVVNYEKDSSKASVLIVQKIATECAVNEIWLLTGKGEMLDVELQAAPGTKNLTKIIVEHQDLIKEFDDPMLGKDLNQELILIQNTDENLFASTVQSIKAAGSMARAIKNAMGQVGIRPTDELIRKVEENKTRGGKEEGDTGKEGTNN